MNKWLIYFWFGFRAEERKKISNQLKGNFFNLGKNFKG